MITDEERQNLASWLLHRFERIGMSLADLAHEGIFDVPNCDKETLCGIEASRSCMDWSNPYGCGGCCYCRGCIFDQYERGLTAPFTWEGDYG